jgi:deoxyribonuclease-4
MASADLIVESNRRRPQGTDFIPCFPGPGANIRRVAIRRILGAGAGILGMISVRTTAYDRVSMGGKKPMVAAARASRSRKSQGRKFGAHMSIAGGCDRAVRAAQAVDCVTVQLFTKNNNQWNAPPLSTEHVAAFREALEQTGIVDPVAHTSYLINLGSPDYSLWEKSIEAMTVEVERCGLLGITDLVVHPGAHMGTGEEAGLARVARGLDEVHRRTKGLNVIIDLETTAGQGSSLGHRFEHLGAIIDQAAHPELLGVCADTCHIFAAGYPLRTAREYDKTIKQLDRSVGLGRLRIWHVNDSVRDCGSRVDRHAAIGTGCMGLEPFRHLVNDPRFRNLPMILETPKGIEAGEDLDFRNLGVLRGLVRPASARRKRG